ncbi:MAG: hypothetical protein PHW65_00115 [Dehalococcoidales bacterium]|nr:hypothetical protein [Dehalococcoidales bacterium]
MKYNTTKRLTVRKYGSAVINIDSLGSLINADAIKARLASLKTKDRYRFIAFLHVFYTAREIQEHFGVNEKTTDRASRYARELVSWAQAARNITIANLAEKRVFQLLQTLNPANISDEKKAQSIKYLMDAVDIALTHTPSMQKEEDSTRDLIFKIESRMKTIKAESIEDDGEEGENKIDTEKGKKEEDRKVSEESKTTAVEDAQIINNEGEQQQ